MLVALGAEVAWREGAAEHRLPVAEFLQPPHDNRRTETILPPGALITSIYLPAPPAGARMAFRKAMERKT